ncbi:ABC transporter permease subunit, partial [Pseudomonas syringae pv. tagetis]|uniref:ABC transporter permease subunit n=1 Tax=Pseudomonas syringae group genomosp. 7 TaxID=251699 RepID=UPI00376F65ED
TIIAVLFGIPLVIISAGFNSLLSVLMPLLDIMQTMPSFVYLIPLLMLFGLGKVPAIFATVIYSAPPLIRLTDLGIRQVDGEVMEA